MRIYLKEKYQSKSIYETTSLSYWIFEEISFFRCNFTHKISKKKSFSTAFQNNSRFFTKTYVSDAQMQLKFQMGIHVTKINTT